MDAFLAMNAMVTLLLAAAWNHDDAKNTSIKVILWLVFVANAFALLKASGYIVKVTP